MATRRLPHLRVLPATRAECKDAPRPCPFVSCRYHLFLDIASDGRLFMTTDADEHDESSIERELYQMAETCALDVADGGSAQQDEVAVVLGITRRHVDDIEQTAKRKLEDKLRVLLADDHPEDTYIAHMAREKLKK